MLPFLQLPNDAMLHAPGLTAAARFPVERYYKIINATTVPSARRGIAGNNCILISEMTGRRVVQSFAGVRGAL